MLMKGQLQKPLPDKLNEAREIIKKHFEEFTPEQLAVCWSGGKDSTLTLYLVREIDPNIAVIFNNTGVEYPQNLSYINKLEKEWSLNLIVTTPEINFWQCTERWGLPKTRYERGRGHQRPKCCFYLKEQPTKKVIHEYDFKGLFVGITAAESWYRMLSAGKWGFCGHVKSWGVCRIRPVLLFKEQEVLFLMKEWHIPQNEVYSLSRRNGCLPCTGFRDWEKVMSAANPKLYEFILQKRGQPSSSALETSSS